MKNIALQLNIYFLALVLFGCTINSPNNPTLTTNPASAITSTSALSGGNVTNNGNATITETGICYSEYPNPTIYNSNSIPSGSTSASFTCALTGLNPNTFYYIKAYALNSSGLIGYGNQQTFNTAPITSSNGANVTDIDGNNYPTIILGNGQTWMQKNLNVSKYRNGDLIPQVQDPTAWANLTTGAWCYYENITSNGITYGKLYNWYAVNDVRGLAPQGWHVPTDAEWTTLIDYLGGTNVAGGKMKSTGTQYWSSPNYYATDVIGFSGLPGGYRTENSTFFNLNYKTYWWSSSDYTINNTWSRSLENSNANTFKNNLNKSNGFSIRCVKD